MGCARMDKWFQVLGEVGEVKVAIKTSSIRWVNYDVDVLTLLINKP